MTIAERIKTQQTHYSADFQQRKIEELRDRVTILEKIPVQALTHLQEVLRVAAAHGIEDPAIDEATIFIGHMRLMGGPSQLTQNVTDKHKIEPNLDSSMQKRVK